MKITCQKQDLVEAVSNVQRAVSSKSTVPALEGILIRTQTEKITLCGFDLELGITTTISAQIEEAGSIVLSARLFGDIVRRLPSDQVEISSDEKNITSISCGASHFSIVGIPSEDYPELPVLTEETSASLPQSTLKSMIRQTIFAVSDSDAKPIHTGTLFEFTESCLRLVSVDGYRLALREEPISCDSPISFVVPGKSLNEVLKLLKDNDTNLTVSVGRRHIVFQIENYTVISRLLEGEFLDYKAAIPSVSATEVVVKTREWMESVERVSLLIADRLKSPICCQFEENQISMSCSTAIGRANDQITASSKGDTVEMGFNNRYLLDALRNAEGDEVRLMLNGALSPLKIVPREGNSFLFLVLPVRLKSNS